MATLSEWFKQYLKDHPEALNPRTNCVKIPSAAIQEYSGYTVVADEGVQAGDAVIVSGNGYAKKAAPTEEQRSIWSLPTIDVIQFDKAFYDAYQDALNRQMKWSLYGDTGLNSMGGQLVVPPEQKALPAPEPTGEAVDVPELFTDPGYWDTLPVGMALTPRQKIQAWADKRGYLLRQMPMPDVLEIDAPKFTMRLTYADYLNGSLNGEIDYYLAIVEEDSRARAIKEA